MADGGAAGQMAKLLLDDVTGEMIRFALQANVEVSEADDHTSKSEHKRRTKQRETEEKKKEKTAAAPPKAEKQMSVEEAENNLTPNVCSSYSGQCNAITLSSDS